MTYSKVRGLLPGKCVRATFVLIAPASIGVRRGLLMPIPPQPPGEGTRSETVSDNSSQQEEDDG